MRTNVVEKGRWERELEVAVEAERIDAELDKAYRKYQKRIEIPGFRKGKVPLPIIRRRFGDSIRSEVISDLLPTLVHEAARAAGLVPAAPARISKLGHELGQELTFTAILDIWPEIEVKEYEKLEITRMTHEVTGEEVEAQLVELWNGQATERSVERPLEKGDVLIADLQRLDETGVPIIGDKYEERYFLIGQDEAPSPQFEEALLGMRAGEQRKVRFAYRQDLPDLAGKEEHFQVTARQVRERLLPALDDEFAKDLGEQFQSLEDVRRHLAEQRRRQWEILSQQNLRSELVSRLIEKNPFELPQSMVDYYLDSLHEHEHEHDHEHGEEERRMAERSLKRHLLLEGVRKKVSIQVSDQEFEEYLARRAAEAGVKVEDLKRSPRLGELRRELEEDKVFEFLLERARITEEKV